jgi:hypothetical protein
MATGTMPGTNPRIPTGTWTVDAAHYSVTFSVRHTGIASVRGKFTELEGTLEVKENLADCRVYGTVKVASIDTGEPQRDDHLRSADFFDAHNWPRARGAPRVGVGAVAHPVEHDLAGGAVHRRVAGHARGLLVDRFDPCGLERDLGRSGGGARVRRRSPSMTAVGG